MNIPKDMLIFVTLFSIITTAITQKCYNYKCDQTIYSYLTEIRFPFRVIDHQPESCGYHGFDVHCNGNNTLIELPGSIVFKIQSIYYEQQYMELNDPDPNGCLPLKLLSLNFSSIFPFYAIYYQEYMLFNCSGYFENSRYNQTIDYELYKVDCLSSLSYTIFAVNVDWAVDLLSSSCQWVANVTVPDQYGLGYLSTSIDNTRFILNWDEPRCGPCEKIERYCGVKTDSNYEIECTSKFETSLGGSESSFSKVAIIWLSIGLIFPVFMVLMLTTIGWLRYNRRQRNESTTESSIIINENHSSTGINPSTLDSYPTVVVSESGRLIAQGYTTCAICLSEYENNEVMKILPDCLHRFHVACIDQWLLQDGTCPICRLVPSTTNS